MIDKSTGLRCDQTIMLTGLKPQEYYPGKFRRVEYFDKEKGRGFSFLSNTFILPAFVIAGLYKCRWQVELLSNG